MKTLRQYLPGDDVIQLAVRLGLLAFLIYWTFVLIRPFVPILAWSIVLAVALYPVFDCLSKLLGGRPKLAAAILTVVNLAIVIGPATWLGLSALIDGVMEFAEQFERWQAWWFRRRRTAVKRLADYRPAALRPLDPRVEQHRAACARSRRI